MTFIISEFTLRNQPTNRYKHISVHFDHEYHDCSIISDLPCILTFYEVLLSIIFTSFFVKRYMSPKFELRFQESKQEILVVEKSFFYLSYVVFRFRTSNYCGSEIALYLKHIVIDHIVAGKFVLRGCSIQCA